MAPSSILCILAISVLLVIAFPPVNSKMVPVFSTMMGKLNLCDILILNYEHKWTYGNIDWFNIDHPVKMAEANFAYEFVSKKIRIHTFKSRFSSECQMAIFLSFYYLQNRELVAKGGIGMHLYTYLVRKGYMFHTENKDFNPNYEYIHSWDKAIIMFVTTQTKKHILHGVYFEGHQVNKIGVLFLLEGNKFKICYWHRKQPYEMVNIVEYSFMSGGLYCDRKSSFEPKCVQNYYCYRTPARNMVS